MLVQPLYSQSNGNERFHLCRFFCLIIISSTYIANLAAFLTVTSTEPELTSVEDFDRCGLKDQPKCKVDFGAKKEGSTLEFFRVSAEWICSIKLLINRNNCCTCLNGFFSASDFTTSTFCEHAPSYDGKSGISGSKQ